MSVFISLSMLRYLSELVPRCPLCDTQAEMDNLCSSRVICILRDRVHVASRFQTPKLPLCQSWGWLLWG